MNTDLRMVIGLAEREHLILEAIRRSHPECTDFWDGNWVACAIDVKVGGFRGHVDA